MVAAQEDDPQHLLRLLHTLRGVAGNLGASALEHAVYTLEVDLKSDPGTGAPDLNSGHLAPALSQLRQAHAALLTELAHYLAQRDTSHLPEVRPDRQQAQARLAHLVALLQESDPEATEYFVSARNTLAALVDHVHLNQLGLWLNDYEFDTALNWITAFQSQAKA
jgi:HPt (histidine-containing phosphotransfer) domain-containing protein